MGRKHAITAKKGLDGTYDQHVEWVQVEGWVPIGSPIEGAIRERLVLQWGTHKQTGGSGAIGTTLQL